MDEINIVRLVSIIPRKYTIGLDNIAIHSEPMIINKTTLIKIAETNVNQFLFILPNQISKCKNDKSIPSNRASLYGLSISKENPNIDIKISVYSNIIKLPYRCIFEMVQFK